MATWPGTLPQYWGAPDFVEQEGDNIVRTRMAAGPEKIRARSTAAPRRHMGFVRLSESQYATMKTFYQTTLAFGTDTFTMDDAHGVSRTMRFVSPPSYRYDGYNVWICTLDLEEMY